MSAAKTNETVNRLCAVEVEYDGTPMSKEVQVEQKVAISDLLEHSYFELVGRQLGPYRLMMSMLGAKLTLHVADAGGIPIVSHFMSISPFRRILREYEAICEAHYVAAFRGDTQRLEAIDMGRRATHNEGSELLIGRMATKVRIDLDTARRLFTIIAASRLGRAYSPGLGPAAN